MSSKEYNLLVSGIVTLGHQVASGLAENCPYPSGTIKTQLPFFKKLGLNLESYYMGTLNINIQPSCFELISSDYSFKQVKWTNKIPAEDFSFSECIIEYKHKQFKAFIYYPHPETKVEHFQNTSLIEIICDKIRGIEYGDKVKLHLNNEHLRIL